MSPAMFTARTHSLLAGRDLRNLKLFVRATGFNELRHNGTPYQTNATRLIRYCDGRRLAKRAQHRARPPFLWFRRALSPDLFEHFESSQLRRSRPAHIAAARRRANSPTSPTTSSAQSAHWSQPFGAGLLFVVGADAHDVRVWDREQTYTGTDALTNLADHQRDSAAYAEAMWAHKAWTLVASSRMDWFQNYDGHETQWNGSAWLPTAAQPPQCDQRIFDPRLGLSRKLSDHWALTASGFRAFRAPTPNELYRSTQVGNQLTLPNGTSAQRARHRMGSRPRRPALLGQRPLQLLPHPGQPAHRRRHHQPHIFAHPAHAREPRPDREPRRLARLRT